MNLVAGFADTRLGQPPSPHAGYPISARVWYTGALIDSPAWIPDRLAWILPGYYPLPRFYAKAAEATAFVQQKAIGRSYPPYTLYPLYLDKDPLYLDKVGLMIGFPRCR